MFGGRVFSTQWAFQWVVTVLPISLIYSFTRTRHSSYRGFWRKTKRR